MEGYDLESTGQKRVLVVDDEPDLAMISADYLKEAGYQVDCAMDLKQAEIFLDLNKYHVVLSDIHFPDANGVKFFEMRIKAKKRTPPFLFMSGNADPAVVERASKVGACDVLQKPFTEEQLVKAIEGVSGKHKDALELVLESVEKKTGVKIPAAGKSLFETRILRRARQLGLPDAESYASFFRAHEYEEVLALATLISSGSKGFFLDQMQCDFLEKEVLPKFVLSQTSPDVHCAACGTGEEVYTLLIIWHELFRKAGRKAPPLQVLGTDIDPNSLEIAKEGLYPSQSVIHLPEDILGTYFDFYDDTGDFHVKGFLRRQVEWERLNLVTDPMPGPFDMIMIRNLLGFFNSDSVKNVLTKALDQLKNGGYFLISSTDQSQSIQTLQALTPLGQGVYAKGPHGLPVEDKRKHQSLYLFGNPKDLGLYKRLEKVVGVTFIPLSEAHQINIKKEDFVILMQYDKTARISLFPGRFLVVAPQVGPDSMLEALTAGALSWVEQKPGQEDEVVENVLSFLKASVAHVFRPKVDLPQSRELLLIAGSTGGVHAFEEVFKRLPKDCPPCLLLLHLPAGFSTSMAERLNRIGPLKVVEAKVGDELQSGTIYIAPGGKNISLFGDRLKVFLEDPPKGQLYTPSADHCYGSVSRIKGVAVSAVILTGMGQDGAKGLCQLRESGAYTCVQDEATSAVFGMPRAALEAGGTKDAVPLDLVAQRLLDGLKKLKKAS